MEIAISAFKRLPGEAVWAIKPGHILVHMATKMVVYSRTRDVMIEAVGR